MSSVVIAGDSSGTVTLQAPSAAGSTVLTLPATSGTVATLTTPSFLTTIGVGAATPAASGAGVTFPATQSASTDANTLDDYEEGTFTPTVASSSGTLTSYTSSGTYTKIGRAVTVNFRISLTNIGTGSGVLLVTNFPFSSVNSNVMSGATREDAVLGYPVLGSPYSTTGLYLASPSGSLVQNSVAFSLAITYNAS